MKKLIFSTILCLIFILPSIADNIFLKNGTKIVNVKILNQDENWIYYQMSNGNKTKVNKKAVLKTENIPFNPKISSKIISPDFKNLYFNKNDQKISEDYPNIKLLTLSVISFALSYDYFKQSDNIQKSIQFNEYVVNNTMPDDKLEKQYLDLIDNLKSQKEQKQILGAVFFTAGIINAIVSFKKVKVKATPQKLSLSYKF